MGDWLCTFGHRRGPGFGNCYITTSEESLVVYVLPFFQLSHCLQPVKNDISSILSLGTFFGALLAAPLADGIGRKVGIMVSCIVFSIGVAMQTAATNTPLFVVGRVGAGLGVGLVSCMIPMYQVRSFPPKNLMTNNLTPL